jgi:hemolysin activation/secretion protein
VLAQTTQQPRLDPNQTEKNLDALQIEQKRSNKEALRLPKVATPEIKADPRPLFKLTAVSIEGARVIPGDDIAETYRPYIGRTVSQADLAAIAGKISDLYRDAGYHLSRAIVPPQDIKNGRIRIRVIEGKIAEIVVKGERAEQFGIRPLLDAIAAEHPSRLKTLERYLLLLNERPGVRVADTTLEEIGTATGSFRLTVYVETWRVYTALALDNWGASGVGPLQSYLTTAFNSYFISGDTLGLDLSTTPDATRELRFGRLFYETPAGTDGVHLGATAAYGEIQPGDDRRILNTHDYIEAFEFRGSITPLETRKSSLRLTATAGFSNDSETDALGTNYRDHVRTVGLRADYQLHDDLGGWNYLTLGVRQGINVFGASQKGDTLLSRSDGSGIFSKLEFSFTRYQKLTDAWSLKMSAAGQWASRPLLESQEFYLGGGAFGRGYDSGEVSGDNGIAGSLELRFDQELKHPFFKGYQLYSFIDRGTIWNIREGKDDSVSLSSVGAGVRLYIAEDLQAGGGIAFPLDYRSPTNLGRDPRVYFSVSKSFKFCPDRIDTRCL